MEKEDLPSPGKTSQKTMTLKGTEPASVAIGPTTLKPELSAQSKVSRVTGQSSRKSDEKNAPLITALTEGSQRQDSPGSQQGPILQVNQVGIDVLRRSKIDTVPMRDFTAAKLERVTNNIISALAIFLKDDKETDKKNKEIDKTKEKISKTLWKQLINSNFNEQIITDGFWLIVLKKNQDKFAKDTFKVVIVQPADHIRGISRHRKRYSG